MLGFSINVSICNVSVYLECEGFALTSATQSTAAGTLSAASEAAVSASVSVRHGLRGAREWLRKLEKERERGRERERHRDSRRQWERERERKNNCHKESHTAPQDLLPLTSSSSVLFLPAEGAREFVCLKVGERGDTEGERVVAMGILALNIPQVRCRRMKGPQTCVTSQCERCVRSQCVECHV